MLPIQNVIKSISKRLIDLPLGKPRFADPRYTPHDFDINYFHQVNKTEGKSIFCFIDGGNMPIVEAHNFSVQLVRVYFNLFKGSQRIEPKTLPPRIEFYAVCYAVENNEKIFYETEFVPIREEWTRFLPKNYDLHIDSFDRTLSTGLWRVPIGKVAGAARLFAEWKYAGIIMDEELSSGDILVRDGSLQTSVTNERKYYNETIEKALKSNVRLLGLSKTSTLFTSTGYSLFAAISELSEGSAYAKSSWFYYPIVDINQPDHKAEMYAVKLHPSSDYVFRLEFLKPQAEKISLENKGKIFNMLAFNASDATFPGYPYGLLDADKLARVDFNERENQKIQFLSCASREKVLSRVVKCLKSTDAHDALNQLIGG